MAYTTDAPGRAHAWPWPGYTHLHYIHPRRILKEFSPEVVVKECECICRGRAHCVLLSQAVVLKDCLSAVSAAQLCCSRAIMRCEWTLHRLAGERIAGDVQFCCNPPSSKARTLWGLLCKVITTSQPLLLMLHCVPRVLFRRRHRQNLTAAAANVVRPTRRHDARRQSISYTLSQRMAVATVTRSSAGNLMPVPSCSDNIQREASRLCTLPFC